MGWYKYARVTCYFSAENPGTRSQTLIPLPLLGGAIKFYINKKLVSYRPKTAAMKNLDECEETRHAMFTELATDCPGNHYE